jgi:hypothetical protein
VLPEPGLPKNATSCSNNLLCNPGDVAGFNSQHQPPEQPLFLKKSSSHASNGLHQPQMPLRDRTPVTGFFRSQPQARTFQKQLWREAQGLSGWTICLFSPDTILPLSQRSPLSAANSFTEEATKT